MIGSKTLGFVPPLAPVGLPRFTPQCARLPTGEQVVNPIIWRCSPENVYANGAPESSPAAPGSNSRLNVDLQASRSEECNASQTSSSSGECPYCHDESTVICPVCEGRGYIGRTITCYYCRGAKRIECPLCIDDVYKLSYVQPKNPTIETDDYATEDTLDESNTGQS